MTVPIPDCAALHLPLSLRGEVWQHAQASAPHECVGLLGGTKERGHWTAKRRWALNNVAQRPRSEYLAGTQETWQTLKEMRAAGLELVGIYHSHPHGPATYSPSDQAQAAYDVPYLIADLASGQLLAYWLPAGLVCQLRP